MGLAAAAAGGDQAWHTDTDTMSSRPTASVLYSAIGQLRYWVGDRMAPFFFSQRQTTKHSLDRPGSVTLDSYS